MQNPATQVRLIPLKPDVQDRTCLGKSRIYELIASGAFPQPCRLGRRIAFVESEIDQWILQRMAERTLPRAV
ncbi:MAG: AlpA family phage regulatory protein [Nitrosomonadales bacterium]|nr:AlpA family phage regulatory protein [Nitrosomonadales bacterium]